MHNFGDTGMSGGPVCGAQGWLTRVGTMSIIHRVGNEVDVPMHAVVLACLGIGITTALAAHASA